ncbi:SHOCT domain-containing protein [Cellulomonas sp. JH27-2]|uniref:SHOCT domain-containing protein n=1 Tax=Cellulomonas sp. JH27-2 TaxID=2774139 RepID=UPI001CD87A81|nr:SHOCT domain-containing protein [Cellulomonas sp. JH27-2]
MPPFRRMGRPGLIGTAARTAVIAGTATAVTGNVARRQAGRAQASAQASYEQQQYEAAEQQRQIEEAARQAAAQQAAAASAPAIAAPAAGGDDIISKLNQLAQLQAAGVLSADEFAAAKAKLLA